MSYRLSAAADADLVHLYLESVREFGTNVADSYYSQLEKTLQIIADNPKIARERPEIKPAVRVHPFKSNLIIYDIDGEGVVILRVRHHRENWLDHPI